MKRTIVSLLIVLIAIGSIFIFLFIRMGTRDAKALADFQAAYSNYDQAITDYSEALQATNSSGSSASANLKQKADEALAFLETNSSVRISSLTKNDGDLMKVSLEIANLARQELDTLMAYQSAIASGSDHLDQLAKQLQQLSDQRQADYARYLDLGGITIVNQK